MCSTKRAWMVTLVSYGRFIAIRILFFIIFFHQTHLDKQQKSVKYKLFSKSLIKHHDTFISAIIK